MTALVAGTQIDVVMSSKTAERAGEAGGGGRERERGGERAECCSKQTRVTSKRLHSVDDLELKTESGFISNFSCLKCS